MQPLSEAEAKLLLEPYMQDLCAPVYAAWRRWEELTPQDRQPLTPRTRANWIFDQTVAHAKGTLDRPPVLTLTEQPGFLVVTVRDRVAVRYKKLDEELGISGIRTGQFRLWGSQTPLEGMEPLTHLVVGYQVSDLGKLDGVMIVCSKGRQVVWHLEAPKPQVNVAVLPAPAEAPAPKITPVRRTAGAAES
jgi:hypothetical protein